MIMLEGFASVANLKSLSSYGLSSIDIFPSAIVHLLLRLEGRRFASYLDDTIRWKLREVSRLFRKWALSPENEQASMLRMMEYPDFNKENLVGLPESQVEECVTRQSSWTGMLVLYRNLTSKVVRQKETPFELKGTRWSIVHDPILDMWNNRLKLFFHAPGPERYYNDSWVPRHNMKRVLVLRRHDSACAGIDTLRSGLLESVSPLLTIATSAVCFDPADPFPAFRQCIPYAPEPELHLAIWLIRCMLSHPPLREAAFGVVGGSSPSRIITQIKYLAAKLVNIMEDDETEDLLDDEDDDSEPFPHMLRDLQQYVQGVLALEPANFWRDIEKPLPTLSDKIKDRYIKLARAYIERKNYPVLKLPWFGVDNLVVKGATITHQLYILDQMGEHLRRLDLLSPFSTCGMMCDHSALCLPYEGLRLPEYVRRDTVLSCRGSWEEFDAESRQHSQRHFYKRILYTHNLSPQDAGRHPGDVCVLYVGPRGAVLCSCNDETMNQRLLEMGLIVADDFTC
eukprot:Gregarina_sp_Poly_1__2619@NODE_1712_length_3489_cov_317_420514_g1121_i0_p1_GENE_NODE_1712_length_3489_cov_317_420514_g1121_i0NODE_1712_length_3489_cov_317_420514_g1121_i0_p1_ORF_typecomplete_len511_score55_10_NODE_1712_length_3489_cov_317_420514_g1121_i017453277